MDQITLKRLGSISERLYCNDIIYYVEFKSSNVIIQSDNFSIMMIYKKDKVLGVSSYYLHDKINKVHMEYLDFRHLRRDLYELIDVKVIN